MLHGVRDFSACTGTQLGTQLGGGGVSAAGR